MSAGEVVALTLSMFFGWLTSSFVLAVLIAPWIARRLHGQSWPGDGDES